MAKSLTSTLVGAAIKDGYISSVDDVVTRYIPELRDSAYDGVTVRIAYLIEAGRTPGSPQLNSFGPNMLLAKELLEKGETATVLEYLDLCTKFWRIDHGSVSTWKKLIADGKQPNFFANLLY